MFEEGDYE
jgi:vacuolar-type H+-ATPase subunit I/STV1